MLRRHGEQRRARESARMMRGAELARLTAAGAAAPRASNTGASEGARAWGAALGRRRRRRPALLCSPVELEDSGQDAFSEKVGVWSKVGSRR